MEEINAGIIDITNLDEHSVINLSRNGGSRQKSANFGEGIELLMNDKRKNEGGNKNMGAEIDLDDLNDLEDELNNLSSASDMKSSKAKSKSGLFSQAWSGGGGDDSIKLNFRDDDDESLAGSIMSLHDDSKPSIGKSTSDKTSFDDGKTWDGFGKFNNVPINPDNELSNTHRMTSEELLLEKFKVLRKLEELERKGARLTKKYSMESSLAEMKGEYEMVIAEKERSNSCKFQGRMLMAAITGLEFLNNRFDPFDVKLDGWAEQLNENIGDYDEIFAELHEKYKSKAKMAPELKLLFQLGGSGIMVHMTNTMFKSAMPGMDDIMRQNPELAQQFTQAAVNSMGQQNPGFGGFMSNFMPGGGSGSGGGGGGAGVNFNNMRPPAPMPTQQTKSERYAPPSNRPDLNRARGMEDGINIQEQFEPVGRQPAERSNKRPEMKGPSDIGDLLAGLKTKTINVQPPPMPSQRVQQPQQQPQQQQAQQQQPQKQAQQQQPQVNSLRQNINTANNNNNASLSVNKVDSVSKFTELPKPKRKQKSDKNTVSLDI
jgi:hypothetical protein